jgi:mannosyltransferase
LSRRSLGGSGRADLYLLASLVVVAAAARFVALGHQSFWVDETVTATLLGKSFPGMLAELPHSESTPPLYYVLAWLWAKVFGTGEAALRSLSALVGTATVPVVFAAGRELVSRRTGLFAAALATVSPLLVWYSQEARAYALLVFLGGLSLLFFARALHDGSVRTFGWWAFASASALLTHYFAVFLIAGEALFLLYHHRRRVAYLSAAAVAAVGLGLLPLAAYQAKFASSKWIRWVDLRERVEETVGQLLVPSRPSIWAGAGVPQGAPTFWALGIVLLAAGVAAVGVTVGRQRRGVLTSLTLGVATVAIPIVISLASVALVSGRGDVFLYRNVIAAWVPLTIAIAAALAAARTRWLGVTAFAGLCAASIGVLTVNATTAHLQRDDWRLVARATAGPGRVIILSPSWEVAGLEFYAGELAPLGGRASIREIDVVSRRWSPSYSPAVRALEPPAPFVKGETRTLQNWVLTVFRAPTPVSVVVAELSRVRPENASRVILDAR